jgi:hypothetical protein
MRFNNWFYAEYEKIFQEKCKDKDGEMVKEAFEKYKKRMSDDADDDNSYMNDELWKGERYKKLEESMKQCESMRKISKLKIEKFLKNK